MGASLYSFILLLTALIYSASTTDQVISREYVWHNFKDFNNYGWYEYPAGHNATKMYGAPSEFDPTLYELNVGITDEVWGWRRQDFQSNFFFHQYNLDMSSKPEFCGLLNAKLSFKYYIQGVNASAPNAFLYPSCTSSVNYRCALTNSNFSTWSTITKVMNISYSKVMIFSTALLSSGFMLIDEVRLNYTVQQGIDCPRSCNHDCEYRALDCHTYYSCIGKRYKEFYTCNKSEGLAFNPATKSCDLMENVEGCHGTVQPPHCVCEYRPHENCSLYYYCPDVCHLEQCEVRQCPSGLLWSVDAIGDGSRHQQCVPPNKASCYNGTVTWPDNTTPEWWESTAVPARL